ncbi:hypothetical protein HYC85_028712 [Camellia sinensis]|uniref:Uncharacterized protein n=1 Tax=Camellia sinensis TaxID=4442 RepID=A0A7J7FX32_CAMSI|nr:hypothetical protein HYC85_028712 [Camellia sinensis]
MQPQDYACTTSAVLPRTGGSARLSPPYACKALVLPPVHAELSNDIGACLEQISFIPHAIGPGGTLDQNTTTGLSLVESCHHMHTTELCTAGLSLAKGPKGDTHGRADIDWFIRLTGCELGRTNAQISPLNCPLTPSNLVVIGVTIVTELTDELRYHQAEHDWGHIYRRAVPFGWPFSPQSHQRSYSRTDSSVSRATWLHAIGSCSQLSCTRRIQTAQPFGVRSPFFCIPTKGLQPFTFHLLFHTNPKPLKPSNPQDYCHYCLSATSSISDPFEGRNRALEVAFTLASVPLERTELNTLTELNTPLDLQIGMNRARKSTKWSSRDRGQAGKTPKIVHLAISNRSRGIYVALTLGLIF